MRQKSPSLTLAGVLLVLTSTWSEGYAQQACGNQDFQGSYGVLGTGAVTLPGYPVTGPFGRAGYAVADGKGSYTIYATASYNGAIYEEPLIGSYEVFPDCRIEFKIEPFAPVFLPATFEGVITDNKREVQFLLVDPPGAPIKAVMRKQSQQRCSVQNLAGNYALDFSGYFGLVPFQPDLAVRFIRTGKFVADGKGLFTASAFVNYGGLPPITVEEIAGTYTVAPDCAVALQYQDGTGQTREWKGALVDNSKGAYLIVNEPGTAITGTLKQ